MTGTEKVGVKTIEILGGEGINNGYKTFTSFTDVTIYIRGTLARNAPKTGGYNKTNFCITWDDGEQYGGRLDIKHPSCEGNDCDLGQHVRDWLEFQAGLKKPAWMSQEAYDTRDGAGTEREAAALEYLRTYDIPKSRVIEVACSVCNVAMYLVPEDKGITTCSRCAYLAAEEEKKRGERKKQAADPLHEIARDRAATIKEIKRLLKKRSGKTWSVTGGRGTAYSWLSISSPPKRRIGDYGYMSPEDCRELAALLGSDRPVHHQGESISYDKRLWALKAARGDFPNKWEKSYHPIADHVNHIINMCHNTPATEAEIYAAYDQMAGTYGMPRETLSHALYILEKRGELVKVDGEKYATPPQKSSVQESEEVAAESAPPAPQITAIPANQKLADKLRALADGLSGKIEKKRATFLGANITHRRARMIQSANEEADFMEQMQYILRTLADMWESGEMVPCLEKVRTKRLVESMIYEGRRLERHGEVYAFEKNSRYFADATMYTDAVQEIADIAKNQNTGERDKKRKIRRLEQDATLNRPQDYFCTPKDVTDRMFAHLRLSGYETILEPSAGSGAMCDRITEQWPMAKIDCIEVIPKLREILTLKGYSLVGHDFLEYTHDGYEVIIMNPPFTGLVDIDHVKHAYSLLRPGGSMVSVMSRGPFYRSDRKSMAFREWLEEVGGESHDLPPGSFKESGTMVNASYIVIHK